jgi:hypothetical protein
MTIVACISKRRDVGKGSESGPGPYADPVNKRYRLDTEKHVRAAWSYINMPKNAAKYSVADLKVMKARIRAAMRKRGAQVSNGNSKKTQSGNVDVLPPSIVTCSLPFTCSFEGEAPNQILYLPKGRSTIHARVNGEPKTVSVEVDETTTGTLQADLEKRLAQPVKPIGGFNHRSGAASFIPQGFIWDAKRGVLLNLNWTKSGKEAIEGRDYMHFSPTFRMKEDRVAGLTDRGEIGSLTNSPAFEHIGEIAAT